eukprot:TRINITY_DN99921_c0_g1_i1.p1 TRINITY_DN99921_c0_g1~~TRINITY_DN99921_c0_g1_i1.p1  ORF type:complete len:268 (-),score=33.85 TRINITY_DN99921_c0_g1_i1:8-694(-)
MSYRSIIQQMNRVLNQASDSANEMLPDSDSDAPHEARRLSRGFSGISDISRVSEDDGSDAILRHLGHGVEGTSGRRSNPRPMRLSAVTDYELAQMTQPSTVNLVSALTTSQQASSEARSAESTQRVPSSSSNGRTRQRPTPAPLEEVSQAEALRRRGSATSTSRGGGGSPAAMVGRSIAARLRPSSIAAISNTSVPRTPPSRSRTSGPVSATARRSLTRGASSTRRSP